MVSEVRAWTIGIGVTRAIRPTDHEGHHLRVKGFEVLLAFGVWLCWGPLFCLAGQLETEAPFRFTDRIIYGTCTPARLHPSTFSEVSEIKSTSYQAASTRARIQRYDGPSFQITWAVAFLSGGPQEVFHFRLCSRMKTSKSKSCCEVPVCIQLSRPLQLGYIAL